MKTDESGAVYGIGPTGVLFIVEFSPGEVKYRDIAEPKIKVQA